MSKYKLTKFSFQNILKCFTGEQWNQDDTISVFNNIFGEEYSYSSTLNRWLSQTKGDKFENNMRQFTNTNLGGNVRDIDSWVNNCVAKLKEQGFFCESREELFKNGLNSVKELIQRNIDKLNSDQSNKSDGRSEVLNTILKLYDRMIDEKSLYGELLIYLMIGSLYNCSFEQDYYKNFFKYLQEKYPRVISTFGDTLLLYAKNRFAYAKENASRLVPYSLTEHIIDFPTLSDTTISSKVEKSTTLYKLATECSENIMVTGAGGSGKTFTLIDLVNKLINDSKHTEVLPIYIPLNTVIPIDYTPVMTYITQGIKALTGEDKAAERLSKWLEGSEKKLLLLLDGFNEVISSECQNRIVNEVKELIYSKPENIKFIITSRYDMSSAFSCGAINNSNFLSYSVDDLKDETIYSYIKSFLAGSSKRLIAKAISQTRITGTSKIKPVLCKPMSLVMYCMIFKKNDGVTFNADKIPHNDFNTLGEIVENYIYLLKVVHCSEITKDEIEKLLSFLAYSMSNNGLFSIDDNALKEFIKEYYLINGIDLGSAEASCSPIVYEKFNMLRCSGFAKDVLVWHSEKSGIINTITFAHQNYRDYFAAAFLKNVISEKSDDINKFYGSERKLPIEVLTLTGDILEEYRCVDGTVRSAVQIALSKHKKKLLPQAVSELIQISVIARNKQLYSFDFSDLDLSSTRLNGIKLYKNEDSSKVKSAKFNGAIIPRKSVDTLGHSGAVYAFAYLEERYLISFSKYSIFCFDMQLRNHYIISDYSSDAINDCCRIPGTNYLVTGDDGGVLVLWKYYVDDEIVKLEKLFEAGRESTFQVDGKANLQFRGSCVEDILFYKEKLWYSAYSMDKSAAGLFCCTFNTKRSFVSDFKKVLELNGGQLDDWTKINGHIRKCKQCRITSTENYLYIAFGRQLCRIDVDISGDETRASFYEIPFDEEIFPKKAYIYDLAAKVFEGREIVLLTCNCAVGNENETGENIETRVLSVDGERDNIVFTKKHTTTFKGYRRFTDFSNNSVFLTAMMINPESDAGLLKLEFNDFNSISATEFPGNTHTKDINCALPYVFRGKKYIATGGLDRSVEILYIEGIENALVEKLLGHTDGIRYIDVKDETTIFSSHYSGEVCVWKKTSDGWKCTHVIAAHSDWVSQTKHFTYEEKVYMVSCSNDQTISVVEAESEEVICVIDEPKSVPHSIGILEHNWIFTVYDYPKDPKKIEKRKHCIEKYKIDIAGRKYSLPENPTANEVKEEWDADIFVGTHSTGTIIVFNPECKKNEIVTNAKVYFGNSKKPNRLVAQMNDTKYLKVDFYLYGVERIMLDDKTTVSICGGKSISGNNSFMLKIWIGKRRMKTVEIQDTELDYCYTFKTLYYNGAIYVVAGTAGKELVTFRIDRNCEYKKCSVYKTKERVLCVQGYGNNIYFSEFNGDVFECGIEELINPSAEGVNCTNLIFRSATGFSYCSADFSVRNTENCDWDDDFKKLLSYYGKV